MSYIEKSIAINVPVKRQEDGQFRVLEEFLEESGF
jgi:hypothetical protein